MKKHGLAALLCICLLLGAGGCTADPVRKDALPSTPAPIDSTEDTRYEIALITDLGTIDDGSFNQAAWQGVERYARQNGYTYRFYRPKEGTIESYLSTIGLAIGYGAKVVVCPGYLFEVPVFQAQQQHPEVHFLLIDGTPHNAAYTEDTIGKNVLCYTFREEQAGFLAGYSIVSDGETELGFLGGMAVPAVIRYGYGFVQGADLAARERGVRIHIRYHYMGDFTASQEAEAIASSWYQHSTDVIFACGGALGQSVIISAAANDGKVIGVDLDQSGLSPTVVTSALKDITGAVERGLAASYSKTFSGGRAQELSLAEDAVGLPMDTSRFARFSGTQYQALRRQMLRGSIDIYSSTEDSTTADLALSHTDIEYQP